MGGRGLPSKMMDSNSEKRRNDRKLKNEKYHEFDDLPSGTHEYGGDGQAQVDWFNKNSNYNELIEQMDSDERGQFDNVWVPGSFMGGMGYRDFSAMPSWAQEAVRTYDKYLDQSYLDKALVVSRLTTSELILGKGNKFGTLEQLQAMEGQVVTSKANLSAGAAKQGLSIGSHLTTNPSSSWQRSSGKSVELKIHIPSGTTGAGMWIGDSRINSGFGREQREFMMNRDGRYLVGKTTYDKTRDVHVVNVTWVGHYEHKYD